MYEADNFTILHIRVKVKESEVFLLSKKQLCDFGKEINHALVEVNQPKEWLIEEVRNATGLYFDRSYLHKIEVGTLSTPGMIRAIRDILRIPDGQQKGA